MESIYRKAARMILNAHHVTAFTGAGISVESGIPPFRGEGGLWSKYDPIFLEINYFHTHPAESWKLIKEIFYDFFGKASPNEAHRVLAWMEQQGLLKAVITQNIDNLHQEAGSQTVYEFHGNSQKLVCTVCHREYRVQEVNLEQLPPTCPFCGGLLKPDFVFFGEPIPEPANSSSFREAEIADVFLLIGTSGEIMPASMIPQIAKSHGAKIIEVNLTPSNYTHQITDIFLRGKATEVMRKLKEAILELRGNVPEGQHTGEPQ